jgi:hypothetical protein
MFISSTWFFVSGIIVNGSPNLGGCNEAGPRESGGWRARTLVIEQRQRGEHERLQAAHLTFAKNWMVSESIMTIGLCAAIAQRSITMKCSCKMLYP